MAPRSVAKSKFAKGLLLALGLGAAAFWLPPWPIELQSLQRSYSLRLLDRNGRLLREVGSDQAASQHWKTLSEVHPWLVRATLAAEDERFYWHPGVDPKAWLRAIRANWRAGRVVQGGSTLTQQLVRLLWPSPGRGWSSKLKESYWALRLQQRYGKERILEAYLNLAPYGLNTYGCEAASRLYFGKPATQLSLAQATFLAVLPRAPESFLPYQNLQEVQVYQKRLLARMQKLSLISATERARAEAEPITLQPLEGAFEAGHFCDYVLSHGPFSGDLLTTLDLDLQHEVEGILKVHLKRLRHRGVSNGAVVVLEVQSGAVLAMAGSLDYSRGQFNACLAGRQAGSTLKPFTYAMGLERGFTTGSLLPDLNLYPQQVEQGYIPRNYDERFHGPVRLREALACSYNVPVVRLLEKLGVDSLLTRLRQLGFARLTEDAHHYGFGLTLGAGEVSLLELARAYRCLARQGRFGPIHFLPPTSPDPEVHLFEPSAAALVTDILKDPQARAPAFGLHGPLRFNFECAVKTGTSKGYRDNWTVGYTPIYVVACWVGNFDGSSMRQGVSGVTGAAPVFHDVVASLVARDRGSPAFVKPSDIYPVEYCEASGMLRGPDCPRGLRDWARSTTGESCTFHIRHQGKLYCQYPPLYRSWALAQGIAQLPFDPRRPQAQAEVHIAFPDSGAVFRLDEHLRGSHQQLHLKVIVPDWAEKVTWQVGDKKIESHQRPFDAWWPLQKGSHLIGAEAQGRGRRQSAQAILVEVR